MVRVPRPGGLGPPVSSDLLFRLDLLPSESLLVRAHLCRDGLDLSGLLSEGPPAGVGSARGLFLLLVLVEEGWVRDDL